MAKSDLISNEVAACLSAFEHLLQSVSSSSLDDAKSNLERQFERFKLWVGNIGAHRKGPSSLDFRLRDASHISDVVHEMLLRLQEMLVDAQNVLISLDEDIDDDGDSDLDFDALPAMSVAQTMSNVLDFISDTVRSLLRISIAIQNPAPHDRYMSAKTIDTTFYERHDIDHVRSMYSVSVVPEWLVQRPGRANTSRRQFLKYSEAHRARLRSGLPGREYEDSKSTVATPLPAEVKDKTNAWKERNFDDTVSQSTVNTTAGGIEHLEVVPFPKTASYGEEFECPLCHCIVSIRDWKHWKSHQFRDMQPYVCTFEDCLTGTRVYGSRYQWEAHLLQHDPEVASRTDCPLCRTKCGPKDLTKHIAREMQKLSLFVVPSELFDALHDLEDRSDQGSSEQSSRESLQRLKEAAHTPSAELVTKQSPHHNGQALASTSSSEQLFNADFDWTTFDLLGPQDAGVDAPWPLSHDYKIEAENIGDQKKGDSENGRDNGSDNSNWDPSKGVLEKDRRPRTAANSPKDMHFEIPKDRNLENIDRLIADVKDEGEIKEIEQQKRLLRNRQAASDLRTKKIDKTEELEERGETLRSSDYKELVTYDSTQLGEGSTTTVRETSDAQAREFWRQVNLRKPKAEELERRRRMREEESAAIGGYEQKKLEEKEMKDALLEELTAEYEEREREQLAEEEERVRKSRAEKQEGNRRPGTVQEEEKLNREMRDKLHSFGFQEDQTKTILKDTMNRKDGADLPPAESSGLVPHRGSPSPPSPPIVSSLGSRTFAGAGEEGYTDEGEEGNYSDDDEEEDDYEDVEKETEHEHQTEVMVQATMSAQMKKQEQRTAQAQLQSQPSALQQQLAMMQARQAQLRHERQLIEQRRELEVRMSRIPPLPPSPPAASRSLPYSSSDPQFVDPDMGFVRRLPQKPAKRKWRSRPAFVSSDIQVPLRHTHGQDSKSPQFGFGIGNEFAAENIATRMLASGDINSSTQIEDASSLVDDVASQHPRGRTVLEENEGGLGSRRLLSDPDSPRKYGVQLRRHQRHMAAGNLALMGADEAETDAMDKLDALEKLILAHSKEQREFDNEHMRRRGATRSMGKSNDTAATDLTGMQKDKAAEMTAVRGTRAREDDSPCQLSNQRQAEDTANPRLPHPQSPEHRESVDERTLLPLPGPGDGIMIDAGGGTTSFAPTSFAPWPIISSSHFEADEREA